MTSDPEKKNQRSAKFAVPVSRDCDGRLRARRCESCGILQRHKPVSIFNRDLGLEPSIRYGSQYFDQAALSMKGVLGIAGSRGILGLARILWRCKLGSCSTP